MAITKQQIVDFYEGFFNQQQLERANQYPGVEQGRNGLVKAFSAKFSSDEYFRLAVDRVVLEYAVVFSRSIDSKEETKAHVVDLYRIKDEQFVEHWDYFDRRKLG